MTMFSLALAPLLALQAAGETAVAIKNDTPETWTVEYPRVIIPFIEDYRRCLNVVNRKVTGKADFEEQHRTDIPRCTEASEDAQTGANRLLANRGEYQEYTPNDVSEIFAHIGRIHIARGADLDNQFTYLQRAQQAARDEYESERPKGLVLELHDASVVKAHTDATAAAAEAAYQEREARGAND